MKSVISGNSSFIDFMKDGYISSGLIYIFFLFRMPNSPKIEIEICFCFCFFMRVRNFFVLWGGGLINVGAIYINSIHNQHLLYNC